MASKIDNMTMMIMTHDNSKGPVLWRRVAAHVHWETRVEAVIPLKGEDCKGMLNNGRGRCKEFPSKKMLPKR